MPDNSADYEDDEGLQPEGDEDDVDDHPAPVSYTHLTLPTILLV